jgi:hypothetical protein
MEISKDEKEKKIFFVSLLGHGVVVLQGGNSVNMPQTLPLISWSGPLLCVLHTFGFMGRAQASSLLDCNLLLVLSQQIFKHLHEAGS